MEGLIEFITNNIDINDYDKYDLRACINKYFNSNYEKDVLDRIIISINTDLMKVINEKKKVQTDERIRNMIIKDIKNNKKKLTNLQFALMISKQTDIIPSSVTGKWWDQNEERLIGSISLKEWYNIYTNEHEKEWEYIRQKDDELKEVISKQREKGLLSYKPGNVLLVHTDLSKTADKNEKRRRRFDRLGVFQNYVGSTKANVRVKVYRPVLLSTTTKPTKYVHDIIVPVFYTRKISESIDTIPQEYKDIYFVE